jgi:hypothetical protein
MRLALGIAGFYRFDSEIFATEIPGESYCPAISIGCYCLLVGFSCPGDPIVAIILWEESILLTSYRDNHADVKGQNFLAETNFMQKPNFMHLCRYDRDG